MNNKVKSTKMTQSQLAEFANMKYSGEQVFNMMVDFYKKWKPAIAEDLLEEDDKIFKLTKHHCMHEILDYSQMTYYMMKRPAKLIWQAIDGEFTVYCKRKEADLIIHRYERFCKMNNCDWPDVYGVTNVLDKLNKWFCHYNEI